MSTAPTFKHAVESFEHGLEHYLDGSDRSRKFALLHLDQAIELFLKEKVVRLGKTIYKSDGTTLALHEAFNSLKDISIPERPRLEEVHDLRNTIQHKGLSPDPESTQFYVEIAYRFVKRFMEDELDQALDAVISSKYCALMEGRPLQEAAEAASTYNRALSLADPGQKVMTGYTALMQAGEVFDDKKLGMVSLRRILREAAVRNGLTVSKIDKLLKGVFDIRNKVFRTSYVPSKSEANEFMQRVGYILKILHCIA